MGRKKQPEYRIVVTERSDARDGRFIEILGHYRPRENPAVIQVDHERARQWLAQGATPSETVHSLFKKSGVYAANAPAEAAPVAEPAAPADPAPETPTA
jgi:small subunit ribosomal protein S16